MKGTGSQPSNIMCLLTGFSLFLRQRKYRQDRIIVEIHRQSRDYQRMRAHIESFLREIHRCRGHLFSEA